MKKTSQSLHKFLFLIVLSVGSMVICAAALFALGGSEVCQTSSTRNPCPSAAPVQIAPLARQNLSFRVGSFTIDWLGANPKEARLVVSHPAARAAELFSTRPGHGFLMAAAAREEVFENRGSFIVTDHILRYCNSQTVESVALHGEELVITGRLAAHLFWPAPCQGEYRLVFRQAAEQKLDLTAQVETPPAVDGGALPLNRVYLQYAKDPDEHFFGFGTQYTYLDLRGRRVPILVSEQGVGRGAQPISLGARLTSGRGVAGDSFTTYAPVPHYITSNMRSLFAKNEEYQIFDLRAPGYVTYELFSKKASLQLLAASHPLELLELYTDYAGRMAPLPSWTDRGVIVGMQGGSATVRRVLADLKRHQVPVSAFWLQDWVGKRQTSFGSQLWWNWQLDRHAYPDWEALSAELNGQGIQLLTYINPFLVDTSSRSDASSNLFAEAKARNYLVEDRVGTPYLIKNTSFSAGLIDLTNPFARQWTQKIIEDNMLALGVKGWMADFGEALPFDSVLSDGQPSFRHNDFPVLWAKLNRDAIAEAGKTDDTLFFMRSGFTRSPGEAGMFWLGDQMVSWDEHDGIKTAVTGLLSSGLSGFTLNHSDTGGYTTVTTPIANYHRSLELLERWMELNTFTALVRTHEGNLPSANEQVWSDEAALRHFAEFAAMYKALAPYRRTLMAEAQSKGIPVVRPLFLHYPEDPLVYELKYQFMLGADFIVAPVVDKGAQQVRCYLPAGRWRHVWSGEIYSSAGNYTVETPIGSPALFVNTASPFAMTSADALLAIHRSFHPTP